MRRPGTGPELSFLLRRVRCRWCLARRLSLPIYLCTARDDLGSCALGRDVPWVFCVLYVMDTGYSFVSIRLDRLRCKVVDGGCADNIWLFILVGGAKSM